jgi:catechol 2,3-dioxygenase-like lactoylglutathione lyase family enzyme
MPDHAGFDHYEVVAFIATTNAAVAKKFYGDALGLPLVSEDDFALVFDAHGTTLRIAIVPRVAPAQYTVLGWRVPDIARAVQHLETAGLKLQRYKGMAQDASGVWLSPSGARVAWFKDPDGNTLSISQES